jgi:hypothetical protein
MATITNLNDGPAGTTPKDAAPKETKSRKERVRDLLSVLETKLTANADKATVADFIRLTQLERELEQDEQPGKVVVTWKESPETET